MIQATTAEMMNARGFQGRTFRLAPEVYLHRLNNISTGTGLKDGQLWSTMVNALNNCAHRHATIDVAVMSFSRVENGVVNAHTALGGGPLALFGGASMFT